MVALPYEVACAFAPDGRELFRAAGGPERVGLTPEHQVLLTGAVFIHNHPGGGSFSLRGDPQDPRARGDVESAACNAVAQTIVVGTDPQGQRWRYTMQAPPGGWTAEVWEEQIRPAMERAERMEFELLQEAIWASEAVPPPDAEAAHRVWIRVAAETGVQYRRERF